MTASESLQTVPASVTAGRPREQWSQVGLQPNEQLRDEFKPPEKLCKVPRLKNVSIDPGLLHPLKLHASCPNFYKLIAKLKSNKLRCGTSFGQSEEMRLGLQCCRADSQTDTIWWVCVPAVLDDALICEAANERRACSPERGQRRHRLGESGASTRTNFPAMSKASISKLPEVKQFHRNVRDVRL